MELIYFFGALGIVALAVLVYAFIGMYKQKQILCGERLFLQILFPIYIELTVEFIYPKELL